jgi:hypothetical protein
MIRFLKRTVGWWVVGGWQNQRVFRDQSHFWTTGKRRAVKRWILTFLIGLLTGVIGVAVTFATRALTDYKFRVVTGEGWAADWFGCA